MGPTSSFISPSGLPPLADDDGFGTDGTAARGGDLNAARPKQPEWEERCADR
jgi:hypothetical protein